MIKITFFIVACVCLSVTMVLRETNAENRSVSDFVLTEVEVLANCESIDGYSNDGHCVHDDVNNYFCKSPGFLQSKNCKQNTTIN